MSLSSFSGPLHLQPPLGKLISALAVTLLLGSSSQHVTAQVNVTTYHNDVSRTAQNNKETILTPANVNNSSFGLLFTRTVDSFVYAQPLYLSKVAIPGNGTHNVVYIATENNTVYAFDADSNQGANALPLWQVNLGPAVPFADSGGYDLHPSVGITGTPVIATGSKTMYVVARTMETDTNGNTIYVQRLHALDVTTGKEKLNGPVVIEATVKGTGVGTDGNGNVPFNPLTQHNRAALLLAPLTTVGTNGKTTAHTAVFIGFSAYGDDNDPYHGWMLGYDATTLQQIAVFNVSPNATSDPSGGDPKAGGSIWMAGSGPASDGNSIYYITGNGTFDPSTGSYGDSIVRMSTTKGLEVADYFTPLNQIHLDDNDEDLGSGGLILLPTTVGSKQHAHLLIGSGKQGNIYLVDCKNLGKFNTSSNDVVQEVDGQILSAWCGPAYFNGSVYFGGYFDHLKAFSIKNGVLSTTPTSASNTLFTWPGGPSISSNGTANGIVWAIEVDANNGYNNTITGGILHAYKASDLTTELYNSNIVPGRDTMPFPLHFATPTIANGKVYVAGIGKVGVYGNGQWVNNAIISPAPGTYPKAITVNLSDNTAGASIYYTLDGTTPSASSTLYTKPFTLSASANLQAIAYAPGYNPSGIAQAEYLIAPVIGTGKGLTGNYYANTQTPSGKSTDHEYDPTINFNWNGGPPGTPPFKNFPGTNWSAEWTGLIQAEITGYVAFTTISNDGVRLWVNGQELINEWIDQSATAYTAYIKLVAGKKYPIKIDYYQDITGSQLQLYWTFLGQPMEIVPESQLYH